MSIHKVANGELISRLPDGEQLRVFLETCPSALIVIDEAGTICGFGRAAEALFGYQEADVLGRDVSFLMAPPHRDRHDHYLSRYMSSGERRIIGNVRIENACDKEGHIFPVEISVGEAHANGMRYFVAFLRDATFADHSRKQLSAVTADQAVTTRNQSMSALAAVIAHELNQPLTTIANYNDGIRDILLKRGPNDEDKEIIDILERCSQQAIRSGALLHRLREFVQGKPPSLERIEVEELVDTAIKLSLINGFRKNVSIEIQIADDLPAVAIDRLQYEQVLVNIIRNAFEAMHAESSGGHFLRISAHADGAFVVLSVCDSGPGFDPFLRSRLFERFATTKGTGMGIGLSICRQVVEAHGGRIWADSECPLGGANISFTMPVAKITESHEH